MVDGVRSETKRYQLHATAGCSTYVVPEKIIGRLGFYADFLFVFQLFHLKVSQVYCQNDIKGMVNRKHSRKEESQSPLILLSLKWEY